MQRTLLPARAPTRPTPVNIRREAVFRLAAATPDRNGAVIERSSQVAEVLEITALALAAGGHFAAARQFHSAEPPAAPPAPPPAGISPFNSIPAIWLTAPLLLAAIARSVAARISQRRAQASPAAQAMSRLAAVEGSLAAQADAMSVLTRQVDKASTRTRIVSRDMQAEVKQANAAAARQGELLLDVAARLGKLEEGASEAEELIAAVQGLTAKQFTVLSTMIAHQKQLRQDIDAVAAAAAAVGTRAAGRESPQQQEVKKAVSSPAPQPQQQQQMQQGDKDEWGRERKVPSSSSEPARAAAAAAAVAPPPSPPPTSAPAVDSSPAVEPDRVKEEASLQQAQGGPRMKVNEDGSVSFTF